MRKFIEYLPDELKRYLEYQKIGDSVDEGFEELRLASEVVLDNSFISLLDDYGCTRWEKMLKLHRLTDDTLEDRRLRILTKFLNQLPYTERRLYEMLESICGKGNFTLDVDIVEERVTVRLDLGVKSQFVSVYNLLEGVVPLNLLLTVELIYNTYNMLKPFTYDYLKKYTYQGLREEKLQ